MGIGLDGRGVLIRSDQPLVGIIVMLVVGFALVNVDFIRPDVDGNVEVGSGGVFPRFQDCNGFCRLAQLGSTVSSD